MLGIFLIYWIGKKYYDLAEQYNKSPWGWAIAAVFIYYGSQFGLGIIIALFNYSDTNFSSSTSNDLLINLLGILIGLGVWYGIFTFLERRWENQYYNQADDSSDQINEIGKDLKS
jgi:hypothetical protein